MERNLKLENRLRKLNLELSEYKAQGSKYSKLINETIDKIKKTENQIKPRPIEISDHFVIRYLERINDDSINRIKLEIADRHKDLIINSGGTCIIKDGDFRIVVKDFVLITITTKESKIKKYGTQSKFQ